MEVSPDSILEQVMHFSTWKNRYSTNQLQTALHFESSISLETLARILTSLLEEAKVLRAKVRNMPGSATCCTCNSV